MQGRSHAGLVLGMAIGTAGGYSTVQSALPRRFAKGELEQCSYRGQHGPGGHYQLPYARI